MEQTQGYDWGSTAASLAATAGQLLGSELNREQQERTNRETMEFNREEAQKARVYQATMSNTAYQRATQDMRLAGINPMLAYMKGGASSPTGGQASVSLEAPKPGEGIMTGVKSGISTAMNLVSLKKDLQVQDTNIANQSAETLNKIAQAKLTANTSKQVELDNERIRAQLPAQIKHGQIDADWAWLDAGIKRIKPFLPFGHSALDSIGGSSVFGRPNGGGGGGLTIDPKPFDPKSFKKKMKDKYNQMGNRQGPDQDWTINPENWD